MKSLAFSSKKNKSQRFFHCAVAFCALIFFPTPVFPNSLTSEDGYVSVGYLKPSTEFGGSYYSYKQDGSANIKFLDPVERESAESFPLVSLGLRLSENIWLGADYLSMEDESEGRIGKRVRFGPFRFFIVAPIHVHYQFDIGRLWFGYRLINNKDENVLLQVGLSSIKAKATAKVEGLGQESDEGILPMPMLGIQVSQAGPYATKWIFAADYSHIEVNDILGRASNITASVEKELDLGFSIGLGYKQFALNLQVNREKYNAELKQKIDGPFIFIRQTFH